MNETAHKLKQSCCVCLTNQQLSSLKKNPAPIKVVLSAVENEIQKSTCDQKWAELSWYHVMETWPQLLCQSTFLLLLFI